MNEEPDQNNNPDFSGSHGQSDASSEADVTLNGPGITKTVNNIINQANAGHLDVLNSMRSDMQILTQTMVQFANTFQGQFANVQGHITPSGVRPNNNLNNQDHITSNEVRSPAPPPSHTTSQEVRQEVEEGHTIPVQGIRPQNTSPSRNLEDDMLSTHSHSHSQASQIWNVQQFGPGSEEADEEVVDQESQFWEESIVDYEREKIINGPELPSAAAGASKVYWLKKMDSDVQNSKLAQILIPKNCTFLTPKSLNREIYTDKRLSGPARAYDKRIQEIQKLHAASATLMLQASTKLFSLRKRNPEADEPLGMLKDSLKFFGTANQNLNKLRRDMIKPCLLSDVRKLADIAPEEHELLFGDLSSQQKLLSEQAPVQDLFEKKSAKRHKPDFGKARAQDPAQQSHYGQKPRSSNQGQAISIPAPPQFLQPQPYNPYQALPSFQQQSLQQNQPSFAYQHQFQQQQQQGQYQPRGNSSYRGGRKFKRRPTRGRQ